MDENVCGCSHDPDTQNCVPQGLDKPGMLMTRTPRERFITKTKIHGGCSSVKSAQQLMCGFTADAHWIAFWT